MKHIDIIKRAWQILWNYKILWIFGILLALTSTSPGNGNSGGRGNVSFSGNGNGQSFFSMPYEWRTQIDEMGRMFERFFTFENERTIIVVVASLICLAILVSILFTIIHYVSKVSLIKMVDHFEMTGEKLTFRQGWKLGWSREAWKLFLINLLVFIPVFLGFLVLGACAALPVLISAVQSQEPTVVGVVATTGLGFLWIFLLILVILFLSIFMDVVYRECVLGGKGVVDSVRDGFRLSIRRFGDVILMWLILLGLRIGYSLVLIPVVLLLVALAIGLGGGVGLPVFLGLQFFTNPLAAGIAAAISGGLVFFLVLVAPLTFLGGLWETYHSATWTLSWRALTALPQEAIEIESLPVDDTPLDGNELPKNELEE